MSAAAGTMETRKPRALPLVDLVGLVSAHEELGSLGLKIIRRIPATHSVVTELAGPPGGPVLMAKTITRSWSSEHADEVTRREFERMGQLRRRLPADLQATVPSPVALFPGSYTLVMTKLPGTPFAYLMRRGTNQVSFWGWNAQVRIARRVGSWLGRFQAATATDPGTFDAEVFLTTFERELDKGTVNGWSAAETSQLRDIVGRAAATAHGTPVPYAARQGDFTPQNVLIGQNSVAVVDWENFGEPWPVLDDIAAFSSYLWLLAATPLYSSTTLDRMRAAFLGGCSIGEGRLLHLSELRLAVGVVVEQLRRDHYPVRACRIAALRRMIMHQARALKNSDVDSKPR